MQKSQFWSQITELVTFHNVIFSALDSTDFLGFGRLKTKKYLFFLDLLKTKNMELSEIEFRRAPCFLFLKNPKKIYTFWFLNAQNPGNQYCLER